MKRAFANRFCDVDDDDAKGSKAKYENLLLDHLQLQKELVSKKRKLYKEQQKRETLLAEVRFLRQRRKYLLQLRSPEVEDDLNQAHNTDVQRREWLESKRSSSVDDDPPCNPCLASQSNPDPMIVEEPKGEGSQVSSRPLRIEHKSRKLFDNFRRVGKRKISSRNKMSLETIKEEEEEQTGHELLNVEKFRNCLTGERRVGQITCL